MPNSHNPKSQRILACVLCSQRKVKCDRKFPCINCIKARVQCVPATSAPRQRRGQTDKEVLERLRKYEELLHKNNIDFEPFRQVVDENESPHAEANDVEESLPPSSPASSTVKPEVSIPSDDVNVWQVMRRGISCPVPESDEESPNDGLNGGVIKRAWDEAFGDHSFLLLGSHKTAVDLSASHPEPVQIFRLWQTYLDNVNPLLKIIHAPSMQTRIIDAASNLKNLNPNLEALMFSIYCMSIISLSREECQTKFGSSKEDLLARYQLGCQQALLNSGYLRSADRNCLTALYLYLLLTGSQTDPRTLSSILGIAIRIAQRMGIHSESTLAKHTPFEAEMRRRLWWALIRLDTRIGEMADYKITMSTGIWDCQVPLNVNDSDLRTDMKEPPVAQDVATEALFVTVCSELNKFIGQTKLNLGFSTLALTQHTSLPTDSGLTALEERMDNTYLKSCLMENPLHFMTMWTTRGYIAKYRLIEHYARCASSATSSIPQLEAQLDASMSYAFTILDCDTEMATSPLTKGYLWLNQFYFPFPAYIHIIQNMKQRPLSKHAARAWEVMSDNAEARFVDAPKSVFALIVMFSKVILPGWEAREAALREAGEPIVLPRIVSLIRSYLTPDLQTSTTGVTPGSYSTVDAGSFLSSMPMMGFGAESMFYNMSIPYAFPGPLSSPYAGIPTPPSNFMSNQLAWTPMDWNTS